MSHRRLTAAVWSLALLAATSPVRAQQPPELPPELELNVEAQEPASPSDDGFVAKMRRIAKEWQLAERLNGDVDGWYPRLGGMTTGSGFAIGPGYRTHVFDGRTLVDLSAAFTYKGYKAVDAKAEWLHARYDRAELWTNFRYQDFPQEDFFGLGVNTPRSTRTNYALESTDISALGIYHVQPWMRVSADIGYFSPTIGRGTDSQWPSTELVFSDAQAPGVAAQPDFLHTTLAAEVDYRDVRGNPRKGGYYKAAYGIWDDQGLEHFDFRRFDVEAAQYVPIIGRSHIIATRAAVAFVNNSLGERVPFYFVPYVGGSHSVRGYEEFRFQDENAFWWNNEYRWAALEFLDVALFYDVGKVHQNWDELFARDLKTGYGVGLRVNTHKRVFVRFDVGFGGTEGTQYFFKMNESF